VKPTVGYGSVVNLIEVGERALIVGLYDHPRLGTNETKTVLTSLIERIGEDGEFETTNTIYKPYRENDESTTAPF
jgi:hypothetical protein